MKENMTNFIPENSIKECNECKHTIRGTLTCKAFPQGIPKEILSGRSHKTPYPGDNGILFAMSNRTKECDQCKNQLRWTVRCKAFPEGIPEEILIDRSHKTPYPGDNGILFEPREK